MPAQLVSLTDGLNILVDKPILLLGRQSECDIQLNSRKVSRRHCCIAQVGEKLIIRDLGSVNGVRINGQRVDEGTFTIGDELIIGNFHFKVQDSAMAQSRAQPSPAVMKSSGKPAGSKAAGKKDNHSPHQPAADVKAPPPVDFNDDDLLEACEEPIALDDEADEKPAQSPPVEEPETTSGPDEVDPLVDIPDDLKLRPSSEGKIVPPST